MHARHVILALLVGCMQPAPFDDAGDVHLVDDLVHDAAVSLPGAPCAVDSSGEAVSSCSGGQYCLTPRDGFPGGYCAPDCRRIPCPEGSTCDPLDATQHYCVRSCTRDADCRVAEGYACRAIAPGAPAACLPDDHPLGHRADGGACFVTATDDAGTTGGDYLAPLPSVVFAEPSLPVSHGRIMTVVESDPSIAADPLASRGGAVVSFIGERSDGWFNSGLTRIPALGDPGASVVVTDPTFPSALDPSVAFDRDGALHLVFLGYYADQPFNAAIRWERSDDGGATWTGATRVFTTPTDCNDGCFAPTLAIGPSSDAAAHEALYVAALANQPDGAVRVLLAHAPDQGTAVAFTTSDPLATREIASDGTRRLPATVAVGTGPAPDTVAVAWVAVNEANGLADLGDPLNRVRVRASHDRGWTFGAVVDAARPGDAPIAQPPWVGAGGGSLHVVYVTGGLSGAWDVVLATSVDGGATFQWRTVDDDPTRCATHAFTGLAVDPASGDAHVLFLDNRYGAGEAVYARCPADPTQRCSRNERVPGDPFVFTTSQDPLQSPGTHSALSLGHDGTLWAAWGDTRSGSTAVYAARGHASPP